MQLLIVDDEPLACEAVANVLRERSDVAGFDVAGCAIYALTLCAKQTYDMVLLDLHMPEMTGMEFVDRLGALRDDLPAIIFVTAHDDSAVAAFERQAADYVLKPFSTERLQRAIDNAKRRTAQERAAALHDLAPRLAAMTQPATRIAVKSNGRTVFLAPSEIISAQADGNYVLLQQKEGAHLLREQISVMEERLQPFGFLRIHRSVLVNSAFVESMEPLTTGEYLLRMKGGGEFNVTRTYKKNLKGLAHFWIGPEGSATEN
jgi:two-component system LytT family response regulator